MNDSTIASSAIPAYVQQLARTYRFFERYKARLQADSLLQADQFNELEDFLWAFFQNCWHVKDWIQNDESLAPQLRAAVWSDVRQSDALLIAADMANGSKHFSRNPDREWVGASESQVSISQNSDGAFTISHEIELRNGDRLSALDAARSAMAEWVRILAAHEMCGFVEPAAA